MNATVRTDVRIRLLGTVELVVDQDPLGGRKQRLLLAMLALRTGEAIPASALMDGLWADDLPEDPQRALQVHISRLRRVLDDAGVDAHIDHRAGCYVLGADPDLVDAQRFLRLAEEGIALVDVQSQRARDRLHDALSLWRGPAFGELGVHPGLRGEAARLEDLHLRALEARIAADLALGRHENVVTDLQQLTQQHPLRETFWGHLLLALYRAGRQGDALEAYERARRSLVDELGADPSPALRQLHGRILRQDPGLDLPAGPPPTVEDGDERPPDARTLAILPFEVIGDTTDAAPLAMGLHNDLLVELSKVPDLTVISRTSVSAYRGTDKAVPVIARELCAGTIIEGVLQSKGQRFRLTVQLIDGRRDARRWVGSYDNELTTENVFAIQSDLAREIASALSTELSSVGHRSGFGRPRTASLDAYRLVAMGRSQFDLKTEEGFLGALAAYEEAVRLDPYYVQAWTGLADTLVSMDAYGHGDRHELLPRAENAVHRALALDPDSAEARTSLGVLHVAYQDAPAAVEELERAISARPGYADAHAWYSWVSLLIGHVEPALASAVRAAELDPRAAEAHAHLALAYAASGRPEEGLSAARLAGRLSPYTTAVFYEGICLYELGRFDDARTVLEPLTASRHGRLGVSWAGRGPDAMLALSLVQLGDLEGARALLRDVDPVDFPFAAGLIHLAIGDVEDACRVFGTAQRLSAWPCLALHLYHRALWAKIAGTDCFAHLVRRARSSWNLGTAAEY